MKINYDTTTKGKQFIIFVHTVPTKIASKEKKYIFYQNRTHINNIFTWIYGIKIKKYYRINFSRTICIVHLWSCLVGSSGDNKGSGWCAVGSVLFSLFSFEMSPGLWNILRITVAYHCGGYIIRVVVNIRRDGVSRATIKYDYGVLTRAFNKLSEETRYDERSVH